MLGQAELLAILLYSHMLPVGCKLVITVSKLKQQQQQNSENFTVSSLESSNKIKYNTKEKDMEDANIVSWFGFLLREPWRSRELCNYFTTWS